MVKNAPTDFRKLLKTYGIPSNISSSVIPLREAESRGILLDLEEHPELASKITGYDALFSTGLSKDYVDKREFNLFISIRELIQNALDEEELISGRPDVQIEQDPFGTWIVDRGRGITLEALRMGESNKGYGMPLSMS
jgi:hypothetical protein